MPQYIYKDRQGHITSVVYRMTETKPAQVPCTTCGAVAVRWYGGENVSVDAAVGAINRDMHASDNRDLFLPTRRDFQKPSDPDGSRGVREWNERHDNPAKGSGKYRPK